MTISDAAKRQKSHYETIHDDYERHYYDPDSMAYRERFYYRQLFDGIDLDGWKVADLTSGSGHTSLRVLKQFPKAEISGFDNSPSACEAYEKNVGRPAVECDLTLPLDVEEGSYDAAIMICGLHHLVNDLPQVMKNVGTMVRPGGLFLIADPNANYVLEGARKIWYRIDRYYDHETEETQSYGTLLNLGAEWFEHRKAWWMGGPGYFLVLNSLHFRLPHGLKRVIAKPLMAVDAVYNMLPGEFLFPYYVAQWTRR